MEDYVTFKTAKKLKEKGFNWICSCYYRTRYKDLFMVFPSEDWGDTEERINAPTISQVLKWLRKERSIYISVFIDDDSDTPVTYEVWKDRECVCTHQGEYFTLKDWSKCELRAIEYTLDNLI